MAYLVPTDTAGILSNNSHGTDRNLYLEFNKFIGEWQLEPDANGILNYQVGKRKYLSFKNIAQFKHATADRALESQIKRNISTIKDLEKIGYSTRIIENLQTQWRLAVGVGSSGPLETGMTLHHLYGYPYIPATSLKGVARASAYLLDEDLSRLPLQIFNNYVEKLETKEIMLKGQTEKLSELLSYADKNEMGENEHKIPTEEELEIIKKSFSKLENIRCIFGSQSSVGAVTYIDGLPREFPKLDVDVLSPHYGKYYMNDEIPGDWMQPIPSFFLTVASNTPFVFSLFSSNNPKRYEGCGLLSKTAVELAEKWLAEGLKLLGIGGKTSAGYGYFENPNERVELKLPRQNVGAQLKKDEAVAEIVSIVSKQVKVKIEGKEEVIICSGISIGGLKLKEGSKIIVMPSYEGKSKKVISCRYVKPI